MPIHISDGQIIIPGELIAEGSYEISGPHFSRGKKFYSKVLSVTVIEKPKKIRLIPIKRCYIPSEGDLIIGKVIDVGPTYWLVDINSPYTAILQVSEIFPRPTSHQKDLSSIFRVGDLLAAKVLLFDFTHDPLLTMKESRLGRVEKGLLVEVSPARVSRVIGKRGQVVNYLKEAFNVEITVGRNGRIIVIGEEADLEASAAYVIKRLCEEHYVADPLEEVKKLANLVLGSKGVENGDRNEN
ncbi:MAG: exosome complex RNA-binding protein Rrp4 [Thermofilaceae archaeon]